jgi:hypothetical protein
MTEPQKYWYQINLWRNGIGIITWYFDEYIELQDEKTKEYIIVHYSKIEKAN